MHPCFCNLNNTGTVPVLYIDGRPIFESTIIARYLDEIGKKTLVPEDPLQRATMDFVAKRFEDKCGAALFKLLAAKVPEEVGG